ncbi:MAG: tetratricopeptide repeat protein, partial [Myxococcota bacterium]|nr:tetratricopeptide repeat protein [Myxococcota bacterium]
LGVVAAGALVVGARWLSDDAADPCSDATREIATVWNGSLESELQAQFAAVSSAFALDAWERVATALDGYATSWASEHRAACRATRVDQHQSEEVLDLRMLCLARGKQELAAVTTALRDPTTDVAQHAVALVQGMSPVARCGDLDALRAPVAPPRDEATASQVRALDAELATVNAAIRLARYGELATEVPALVERATKLGYLPTVADAWLARAELASGLADSKAAEHALYEAVWAAQASRHHRAEVIAWTRLLGELGTQQARHDEGIRMFRHALAALAGHGEDGRLRGQLLLGAGTLFRNRGEYDRAIAELDAARIAITSLRDDTRLELSAIDHTAGTVALALGKYDDALARFTRTLEIRRRVLGPRHPDVGKALLNIGNVHKDRHDYPEALEHYLAAEQLFRESLPATHPHLGAVQGNLGLVLMEQGKYPEALARQHAALANFEANRGPDHPQVATELSNIGLTLTYAKRPLEALPYFERARAIFVKTVGAEHLNVAMADHNLGLAYRRAGELAKAEAKLLSAIALRRKVAPTHPELARSMQLLATMWSVPGRYDDAAALYEAAIPIWEKAHGPAARPLVKPLLDLGWVRNRQRRFADAIAPLERAATILATKEPKDPLLGVIRFELAQALWETRRDRGRAVEQATLARSSFDPATQRDDVAEIDAWLAKHRVR